ncbi:lipid-A-disaccharide synthase [soil metagenome]
MTRIAIVAGEPSGDFLAAGLIKALLQHDPNLIIEGIAGPEMLAAGCKRLVAMERLSIMGGVEIISRLPDILKIRRQLVKRWLSEKPDIFIGIDAPEFNLSLEKKLHASGIRTVHYTSPTVWAWRKGRIRTIRKATSLMLTLFPFESAFYENSQVPVRFVGHPLADEIPLRVDQAQARASLNLPATGTLVAMLPGSRVNEVKYLAEPFLRTAIWCRQHRPNLNFIVPMINQARLEQFEAIKQRVAPELPLTVILGQSRVAMAAADAVLLASGTASLEALLLKRSMVVAYRLAPLSFIAARLLVKTPYIALPNLLAGRKLVPEFIQHQVTPESLGTALLASLEQADSEILMREFAKIHIQLRRNASEEAAKAVLELLSRR